MSAAQGLYAETTGDVTATGSGVWEDCATLADTLFTANKEYIIFGSAYIEGSGGAAEHHVRLVRGTTPTEFTDGDCVIDPPAANGGFWAFFMYRFTQPTTRETIKIQIQGESTNVCTCLMSQIEAIKLSDDFTENTDFYWNEVTADYTTTGSMAAQAAVTFTPNGTDDWLIIAHLVQILPSGATTNFEAEIYESVGATTEPFMSIEGEDIDAGDEARHIGLARVFTPSAVSHTFSVRVRHTGAETFVVASSRIFAFNLNKMNQHAFVYTSGADAPSASPTFETEATISVTPSVTGDWFYFGTAQGDMGATTAELNVRLQDNNSGAFVSAPNYGDNAMNPPAWDATNDNPHGIFNQKSLTSGASRTINFDFTTIAGTPTVKHRSLFGFSLELAGAPAGRTTKNTDPQPLGVFAGVSRRVGNTL